MRATESRVPRLTLNDRTIRRSQPAPAPADDAPFDAVIGALIGTVSGVGLWALIAAAIRLRRRG